jgi:peptide-methionine (R)-S-oxide reductase
MENISEILNKRRTFLHRLGMISFFSLICSSLPKQAVANTLNSVSITPLDKPHESWRKLVSSEAFLVLFKEETEPPGSSELNHEHRDGQYLCAACYLPLFESKYKYDSGTGWPSFTQPIAKHVGTKRDYKMIIPRTEYHCARCEGHQGHVFKDGPLPRKERWCNNGIALHFVVQTDLLPSLRG